MLEIDHLLNSLEMDLREIIAERQLINPLMIGVRTGGVWIAEHLHRRLNISEPLGLLDISFYRDDFSQIGVHPNVKPSQLPSQVEGRNIIVISAIDNLVKGASGQAVQNMNIMFGFDEKAGL